ncbi:MAG: T9SS type A sorting domain-containing protein, partial [Ignavibacteriaceae bacterium]
GYSDTTWGSPVNAYAGYIDVFATKLNSSGVRQGNTFMGCSSLDYGGGIAIDGSDNFYVTGYSGATWGSPIISHAGVSDAFAVKFNYSNIVDVEIDLGLPTEFELSQNYPNPFNPTTTIKYSIPKTSYVTLKVYDILGKEVATLLNKDKSAGNYQVKFNASNLPSGVYFYRIKAGSFNQVRKMLLIK